MSAAKSGDQLSRMSLRSCGLLGSEKDAMHRRAFVIGGICTTAVAGLPRAARAQAKAPIKIGAFGPMSGNAAAQGQSVREAVEMVVNIKNAAGGVIGRPIELIIGDDAGKPEEAAVVAR